jgi:hypothetical protein
MLTYTAMYTFLGGDGVHGEVLDYPGVVTCGSDLSQTRRLLAAALVDMAETNLEIGEPLPIPVHGSSDPDADIVEPIHLILNASSGIKIIAERVYEAA